MHSILGQWLLFLKLLSVFVDRSVVIQDRWLLLVVYQFVLVGLMPLKEECGEKGTMEELFKHVEYIISKWGIDYVAFSSDIYPLSEYPFINDRRDVLVWKDIKNHLVGALGEKKAFKILYENWYRVLNSAL